MLNALFCHFVSILYCLVADYDKALRYARKAAGSYVRSSSAFSSGSLERHIERCADRILPAPLPTDLPEPCDDRIGVLASTILDVGGHTECLMRFCEGFYTEFQLHLFLTNSGGDSRTLAPKKYSRLEEILEVTSLSSGGKAFSAKITALADAIVSSRVKMLFVYMHLEDVVSCAVLSYLAKHTRIKIIFFNHGDHTFSLGFEFSRLIIELRRQGQFVTQHYRKKQNTTLIPLQGIRKEMQPSYSDEEILAKRRELGLSKDDLVSLSGFASYKVFRDKKNRYLNFVKDLLLNEPRCKHVIVTELSPKEERAIAKVFKGSEHLLDRLILVERVAEFDLLLQMADVFIDSFPLGSALVHIDAIRNRRPTVIKKDAANELYTFYNYLYDDYEYAVEDLEEMLVKTLFLLRNSEERQRIALKCYTHYLSTYEFEIVKKRYRELICNHESLEQFYASLPAGYTCTIGGGA